MESTFPNFCFRVSPVLLQCFPHCFGSPRMELLPFVEVTKDTFPAVILGPNPLLLVCCSSSNESSCKTMQDRVQQAATEVSHAQGDVNVVLATLAVDSFPAVVVQLGITHFPTTYAVYKQQFLDSLQGCQPYDDVESFISKFLTYASNDAAASPSGPAPGIGAFGAAATPGAAGLRAHPASPPPPPSNTQPSSKDQEVQVDVQKLITHARSILKKGLGMTQYAVKFYEKALKALEAVEPEFEQQSTAQESNALRYSFACCYSGLANCAIVEGDMPTCAQHVAKLREQYQDVLSPETEPAQTIAMHAMLSAVGLDRLPQEKRIDQLREVLRGNPKDPPTRARLALLLFAEARLEDCLTECIKIARVHPEWQAGAGMKCVDAVLDYLGQDHILAIRTRQLLESLSQAPDP